MSDCRSYFDQLIITQHSPLLKALVLVVLLCCVTALASAEYKPENGGRLVTWMLASAGVLIAPYLVQFISIVL